MPTNIGVQTLYVKFFDPVDSVVANGIAKNVRKTGIYSGGYLTRVSDTTVTLSPLECEISDGTYQIRALTGGNVSLTVSSVVVGGQYIVLRWTYTGSASNDYLDFQVVPLSGILTNDLIVGQCIFSGSTLTGFVYTNRSTPNVHDLFLKVEPSNDATNPMKVRIRAGKISYGTSNIDIIDQLSPLLVAPGSNSYIALIQITAAGALSVAYGATAVTPTAPDYSGLVTLAEITIPTGATTITASMIKDVRSYVASGNNLIGNVVLLTTDQTVAGVKTFTSFPVTPSTVPTTDYQVANKVYVDSAVAGVVSFVRGMIMMWSGSISSIPTGWYLCNGQVVGSLVTPDLRDKFIVGAKQDVGGVAKTAMTDGTTLTQSGASNFASHNHTYTAYQRAGSPGGQPVVEANNPGAYTISTTYAGSGTVTYPPYYALAFIIKG